MDVNDQLDLDSEHNDDDLESDLLSDSEDRAGSAEEFQWSPTLPEQILSLRILSISTTLLFEFFKLFITDDFVTKMPEQTNFYAVQRGSPQSFKPVSDGVMNLYLYINIQTDSGRRPETIFGCSLCKTHTLQYILFC